MRTLSLSLSLSLSVSLARAVSPPSSPLLTPSLCSFSLSRSLLHFLSHLRVQSLLPFRLSSPPLRSLSPFLPVMFLPSVSLSLSLPPFVWETSLGVRAIHATHMHESCHTYAWVMPHIGMSHATHIYAWGMSKSCHTHEWGMSHIWMRHITNMNESCHICEWVMSESLPWEWGLDTQL